LDESSGNGLIDDETMISVPSGRQALGAYNLGVNKLFNDDIGEFNVSVLSNDDDDAYC
jgi:hypothetical protein